MTDAIEGDARNYGLRWYLFENDTYLTCEMAAEDSFSASADMARDTALHYNTKVWVIDFRDSNHIACAYNPDGTFSHR